MDTHLQTVLKALLAAAPRPREHYDRLIQRRTGKSGKPIYDIQRGRSLRPSLLTLAMIADVLDVPVTIFMPDQNRA